METPITILVLCVLAFLWLANKAGSHGSSASHPPKGRNLWHKAPATGTWLGGWLGPAGQDSHPGDSHDGGPGSFDGGGGDGGA